MEPHKNIKKPNASSKYVPININPNIKDVQILHYPSLDITPTHYVPRPKHCTIWVVVIQSFNHCWHYWESYTINRYKSLFFMVVHDHTPQQLMGKNNNITLQHGICSQNLKPIGSGYIFSFSLYFRRVYFPWRFPIFMNIPWKASLFFNLLPRRFPATLW